MRDKDRGVFQTGGEQSTGPSVEGRVLGECEGLKGGQGHHRSESGMRARWKGGWDVQPVFHNLFLNLKVI